MLHMPVRPAERERSGTSCCQNMDIVSGKVTTSPKDGLLLERGQETRSIGLRKQPPANPKWQSCSTSAILCVWQSIPSEPAVADASLYHQIPQLIHQTGQLVSALAFSKVRTAISQFAPAHSCPVTSSRHGLFPR